jgi:D-arabinose 1-dehydrogenase-like Zn-dependent alcohol dehydrogenase
MKALVLHEWNGPLVFEERPRPEPGPGEVLVRVLACAPDAFDVKIREGRMPGTRLPLVLGHEIAGEVAALGEGVEGLDVGQRVTNSLYLTCGHCRLCRVGRETLCLRFGGYIGQAIDGGYADYVLLPARNVFPAPDQLTPAECAILGNCLGTAYHAVRERAQVRPLDDVVVVGAGGGVGIHAVQMAALFGGRVIAVDLGAAKLDRTRELGADAAVDPSVEDVATRIRELTEGKGADVVIELAGTTASLAGSVRSLARAGRLVVIGSVAGAELRLDPALLYGHEYVITGSRNYTRQELLDVMELVCRGKVQPVISQVFPLEQAETVHELLRRGEVVGRVALEPSR